MEAGIPAITVRASGNDVLGVLNGSVIRVWTLASYSTHREFGAASGERITFAAGSPAPTRSSFWSRIASRSGRRPAATAGSSRRAYRPRRTSS
jgi:hypothetical protein